MIKNVLILNSNNNTFIVVDTPEKNNIYFESYDIQECKEYILKEYLKALVYLKDITIIPYFVKYLSDKKQSTIENCILSTLEKYGNTNFNTDLLITNNGIYIKATNSPYSFTFYVNSEGVEKRKERNLQVLEKINLNIEF